MSAAETVEDRMVRLAGRRLALIALHPLCPRCESGGAHLVSADSASWRCGTCRHVFVQDLPDE